MPADALECVLQAIIAGVLNMLDCAAAAFATERLS
jgi:hypothetical protein